MATAAAASNKAKIARRVIEVLDFFDEDHREATVMDIVRRYDRPQSSTSELLSSLVELGILHKDPYSRSYRLTARAAMLGASGQPEMIRDGSLIRLLDRLAAQTGLSVGLFSMVGLDSQIIGWREGRRTTARSSGDLLAGMKSPLTTGAPGWLMLSIFASGRLDGMLRRLNAEASEAQKFAQGEMLGCIEACARQGHAVGPVGFGSEAQALAMLVPDENGNEPLAIALVHESSEGMNRENLLRCMEDAMQQCLGAPVPGDTVHPFPHAA